MKLTKNEFRIMELEENIRDIFKMFDECSCIKDDKWYHNLKETHLNNIKKVEKPKEKFKEHIEEIKIIKYLKQIN